MSEPRPVPRPRLVCRLIVAAAGMLLVASASAAANKSAHPPAGAGGEPDSSHVRGYGPLAPQQASPGVWDAQAARRELLRSRLRVGAGERIRGSAKGPERGRGGADWASVYQHAAPAVFFIALSDGYGSGFLIDRDGWLLTNHHVASAGRLDDERHWKVNVFAGSIGPSGTMVPAGQAIAATVYGWNVERDLAVLKLDLPPGHPLRSATPLTIMGSEAAATPGSEVASLGNAGLGLLWAMKPGHVSAVGTMAASTPDLLFKVDEQLRQTSAELTPEEVGRLQKELADETRDWIGGDTMLIQATASTSPGDSGGPLLDAQGRVVGITMGMRSNRDVSAATYFYVHGHEIERFLSSRPDAPLLELARDIWQSSAVRYSLEDLSSDTIGGLLIGRALEGELAMAAVDLDGKMGVTAARRKLPVETAVFAVHGSSRGAGLVSVVFRDGLVAGADEQGGTSWTRALDGEPTASAGSADGSMVAVAIGQGHVALISTADGALRWEGEPVGGQVDSLAFAADSRSLWVGAGDGSIAHLDGNGEELDRLTRDGRVVALAPSPDGRLLAGGDPDRGIWLQDVTSGEMLWQSSDFLAYRMQFTPDGRYLVATPDRPDPAVFWIDAESGTEARQARLSSSPWGLAQSADGSRLAVELPAEGLVALLDGDSGELLHSWPLAAPGDRQPLHALLVSNERLGAGDIDGSIALLPADGSAATTFKVSAERLDVDLDRLVANHSFDAEMGVVLDPRIDTAYLLYDLDDDGSFEIVRIDEGADRTVDAEYRKGPNGYQRVATRTEEPALLPLERVRAPWRDRYAVVLGKWGGG